jgi:hypothetical protein
LPGEGDGDQEKDGEGGEGMKRDKATWRGETRRKKILTVRRSLNFYNLPLIIYLCTAFMSIFKSYVFDYYFQTKCNQ